MLSSVHNILGKRPSAENAVFLEMIDILYQSRLPIVVIGVTAFVVGLLVAVHEHQLSTLLLALGTVPMVILRLRGMIMYRAEATEGAMDLVRAQLWEKRYARGSYAFAILLGALSARALVDEDPYIPMLVTGMLFGYGAGMVSRVAIRPYVCIVSIALATVPAVLALGIHLRGEHALFVTVVYAGQIVLLAGFAVASLGTARHSYRTVLEQIATKRNLAALAGHDALTGLANRIVLRDHFNEGVSRLPRSGGLLALHCLDLDRFKAVNDTYGHPLGDALLQAVAGRLQGVLRAGDMAARLGGDEFVVIQASLTDPDEASALAQRIIEDILDYVPASFKVVRHIEKRFICKGCDKTLSGDMPAVPIERGKPGVGLLAHVLVSKFDDHLPLYRQSEIYSRDGVEISRLTRAD